jgi:hypothetical protein
MIQSGVENPSPRRGRTTAWLLLSATINGLAGEGTMQEFPINWWAVLVAAIVKMAIGAAWYSPLLFGPRWMALASCSEADMKARLPRLLTFDFVASLIMAFVLVHAVHYAGAQTLATGAAVGFFNWLGFIATVTFGLTVYEKRPWALFGIANGFQLVSLLVMGAILAVWT